MRHREKSNALADTEVLLGGRPRLSGKGWLRRHPSFSHCPLSSTHLPTFKWLRAGPWYHTQAPLGGGMWWSLWTGLMERGGSWADGKMVGCKVHE